MNNQLQVVPGSSAKAVEKKDEEVQKDVKNVLTTDPMLKTVKLTSRVNAGVVTLEGTAESTDQVLAAATAVRKVPGVKSVVTTAVKVEAAKPAPAAGTNAKPTAMPGTTTGKATNHQ